MSFTLEITEEAESEAREAFLWYNEVDHILADRFESELSQAMNSIIDNPNKYQIRYKSIRIKFLESFPYGIHYVVEHETILVLGIIHTLRSPGKWRGK